MNFNSSGDDRAVERRRALVVSQRCPKQLDRFTDICKGLFDCFPLGLATFQFRTPSVVAMLVRSITTLILCVMASV